ncbi:MAG: S23 ribosomal protein family protein [Parcubacteria group bacterium GW2011_GWA1_40_21]|nr:MAG: S23 ribosomal protein family protein [Parcubacteria group bacterium GW2011_GWA1_40_21]
MIKSHKDLTVWQKAMDLVVAIYELTEKFPKTEIYGLVSQMRRAAISIPSNIAEGKLRGTRKNYRHFILIAMGSGGELETQTEVAKRLPFGNNLDYQKTDRLLEEIMKMLNSLSHNLKPIN